MTNDHLKLNETSRRGFLATTAKSCFGLTIGGSAAQFFNQKALAADPAVIAAAAARQRVSSTYSCQAA